MFNQYPYLNENDLNLDFLLKKMFHLQEIVEQFVALETVTFADPIQWDISTQYPKNRIVLDKHGNAFLSKKPVPAGVQLENTDYWLEIFNYFDYVKTFNGNLTVHEEHDTERATHSYNVDDWLLWDDVLYKVTAIILVDDLLTIGTNIEHFTVEDFCRAWQSYMVNTIQQYKDDIDASELAYKNQLAADVTVITNNMQAQLDAAIAGVTVDSEVINARIGYDGTTYSTLGEAIRTQIGKIAYDLYNVNEIAKDIEKIDISASAISTAAANGITVTVTGRNTFTLNGTATGNFWIDIDWGQSNIWPQKYAIILKRNDYISYDPKVYYKIGYLDAANNFQETETISVFNKPYIYKFPSDARKTNNTLYIRTGATFAGTTFEFIIADKPELINYMLSSLSPNMIENKVNKPLVFNSAAGYYDEYATFNPYANIWTAEVSITYYRLYYLNYRAFYGVCETIFYDSSNNIIRCDRRYNDGGYHENVPIMPPANAVKALIQMYGDEDVIKDATKLYYIDGLKFDPASNMPIFKKKIAYNGDSICEGRTDIESSAYNGGAYPELIAQFTNGTYENRGLSGGILASSAPGGTPARFVVSDIVNMTPDADLICFEGGLNDYWLDVPLGNFDPNDYTGAVNTATVCGALESIFRQATAKWVGKPICFVIPHRAVGTKATNAAGYNFAQMREKIIGICNKYSIPYYDAFIDSGLNGYNSVQANEYLTGGSTPGADGIHPNKRCYEKYYVPQLITLFNKIMPY